MKAGELDRLIKMLHNAKTSEEAYAAGDAIRNVFADQATMLERYLALADELENKDERPRLRRAVKHPGGTDMALEYAAKRIREIAEG